MYFHKSLFQKIFFVIPLGLTFSAQAEEIVTEPIRTFTGHSEGVRSVAFSPDGKTALSGGWNGTLNLWDIATGQVIHTFHGSNGSTSTIHSVAYSPDGQTALSGSWREMKLWNVSTGVEIRTLEHSNDVYSVAYSLNGETALSGSIDMHLWDISTGTEIKAFKEHSFYDGSYEGDYYGEYPVAYSPDEQTALSGGSNMKLWNLSTGDKIHIFSGHSDRVLSVAYSPDGLTALSGSGYLDGTMKLWNLSTGEEIRTFADPNRLCLVTNACGVRSVAYSPDGQTALSGSDDVMSLWNLSTGKLIRTFRGSGDDVMSVAYSPDGQTALSGSLDGTMKLWNLGLEETSPPNDTSDTAFLQFTGLKNFYTVGETVEIEITETIQRNESSAVDLWAAVELPANKGGGFLFKTRDVFNPWSENAQAYKTALANTETSHHIFDFELPEGMGGKYVLYAVYVEEGKDPTQENGFFYLRSNLAREEITLDDLRN